MGKRPVEVTRGKVRIPEAEADQWGQTRLTSPFFLSSPEMRSPPRGFGAAYRLSITLLHHIFGHINFHAVVQNNRGQTTFSFVGPTPPPHSPATAQFLIRPVASPLKLLPSGKTRAAVVLMSVIRNKTVD